MQAAHRGTGVRGIPLSKHEGKDQKTGPSRPRLGRPAGRPATVRSQRVVTFVTKHELEQLERLADRSGASLSSVVHEILARGLKDPGRSSAHP